MQVDASVILPVLDERSNLKRCFEALQTQTLASGCWELLIVDNGSTDGSLEISRAFAACDDWRSNGQLVSVRVL